MSKYRKNPEQDSSALNPKNIMIWGLALILLLGLGVFLFMPKKDINLLNNCPQNQKDINKQGITAILIDLSDPLSVSQEEALKNEFKSLTLVRQDNSRLLSKGDKLVVYLANGTEKPDIIFDMCSPGAPDERKFEDKMTEGKFLNKAKWENFSQEVIDKLTKKFVEKAEINSSPIIESIAFVRNKEFARPEYIQNNKINNLLIVSDMIQNSAIHNRYAGEKNFRDVYDTKPINLFGLNLRVLHVINPKYKKYQNANLVTWWRNYFALAKGKTRIWSKL